MPVLGVDFAKQVIFSKRGQGAGFSGIENLLFHIDNTRRFCGGGQEAVAKLVQEQVLDD